MRSHAYPVALQVQFAIDMGGLSVVQHINNFLSKYDSSGDEARIIESVENSQ